MSREAITWIVLGVTAILISCGCVSSEHFYKEVSLSRKAAYRQWKSRKERQEQSRPAISGTLSVKDCLKLSLVHNKVLQRVLEEKEVARGDRLKSYSVAVPSVDLSGEFRKFKGGTTYDVNTGSEIVSINLGDLDAYSTSLRVIQPIYAGGSIPATLNAAKLGTLLADQTVQAAIQNVVYAAQHAYYDMVLSQHLVEISADAVRSAKAHLDNVKQKRQGGMASDFDVLRAEVELSNFQAELIRNRNVINIAKANLVKVMGVSQDSEFVLSDELVYVTSKIGMEQAVETAFKNRPDLFAQEFDVKYQKELLKIARSRYLPTVGAYVDSSWSKIAPDYTTSVDVGHLMQIGVTATLPIFDGFGRKGEIVKQKARLKQSQIDLIDTEETALFELTKALLSIQDAEEFVESQRLNLTRAKEGLRLSEAGYTEGTNTQVEMIDAQAALTTARANYYQAIYSHVVAKLDLHKAMGTITNHKADAELHESP